MKRMKKAVGVMLLLGAVSVFVGCSSNPPAEETKSMKAGDGSQAPTATGATGAGAGASGSTSAK